MFKNGGDRDSKITDFENLEFLGCLDRAALVSGVSDQRPMRYHGKFQNVVSLAVVKILFHFDTNTNVRENFEEYFLKKFWVIFSKISRIFSENYGKIREIFWKVSRNIADILEKYFKNFESRLIAKNLKNRFIKFWTLYHWRLKIISKNFGIFRGILWTFLRSTISENIEKIKKKSFE